MTKGEARQLYLQYIGEATVNGSEKRDKDLQDSFEALLFPAMMQVGGQFPSEEETKVSESWNAPTTFRRICACYDKSGASIPYRQLGSRHFVFPEEATIVWERLPDKPNEVFGDDAVLDIGEPYVQLVPLQVAIDMALGLEEYRFMIAYLSDLYNSLLTSFNTSNLPTYIRQYEVM